MEVKKDKLRVVAYARVSTEMEEQQTSFNSQKQYYYDKINSNPEWDFKGIYYDEGISGTQVSKRLGFVNMIRDAKLDEFDLILTKSVSRFARNTLDSLKYIRLLKSFNVGVYFEEENINTLSSTGELLLTILSSLAQQESETISSHRITGNKMAILNGTKNDYACSFGYDYDRENKMLVINEEQAKIVKKIFEIYDTEEKFSSIIIYLKENNIKSPNGKDFWTGAALKTILLNEKYIGNSVFGKSYTIDPISHRKKLNKGEKDFYRYKDHHEAIIDKELFDRVNLKYQKKHDLYSTRYKSPKRNSIMAYRSICGFCNSTFTKKVTRDNYYICQNRNKKISFNLCPNSTKMKENDVINSYLIMITLLKKRLFTTGFNEYITERLNYTKKLLSNRKVDKFDYDLFDKLIQYIIIGGYDTNNQVNANKIRFILKRDDMFTNKYRNKRLFVDDTLVLITKGNVTLELIKEDNNLWKD